MTAGSKKSDHNPCPVCGKPRGKGPHEFAHGKCAEARAAKEGKAIFPGKHPRPGSTLTVEQVERGKWNQKKKKYLSGELPEWMFF